MGAATDHITAEQYFLSSRSGDRTQLIDGVMVVNEPRFLHGVVQLRIATALDAWTEGAPGRGRASMLIDGEQRRRSCRASHSISSISSPAARAS